ncbi:MAG: hypothetical protein II129_07660 [Paludibacteraceae bacterium]|nr:hypothetical protein [Paludibacteraceae bacterium]
MRFNTSLIAVFASVLALSSCGKSNNEGSAQSSSSGGDSVVAVDAAESAAEIKDVIVDRIKDDYTDKQRNVHIKLVIDFPVNGPQPLLDSIRTYISESLSGNYKGDMADGRSMVKFYHDFINKSADECLNDMRENFKDDENAPTPAFGQTFEAKKVYESDKVVTYSFYNEYYCGGMYGALDRCYDLSFFKPSGRFVTVETLFVNPDSPQLHSLIGRRYKAECEKDGINFEDAAEIHDFSRVPFPMSAPYVTKDGIAFSYGKYDLNGAFVTFTIKADELSKFMTNEAKAIFD